MCVYVFVGRGGALLFVCLTVCLFVCLRICLIVSVYLRVFFLLSASFCFAFSCGAAGDLSL